MKFILSILLFCFTLVSAGQAAPVGGSVHHEDGFSAVTVQPSVSTANFIKVEEILELDDLLSPVVSISSTDVNRLIPPVPTLRPEDTGELVQASTPLYLAIRAILI